MTLTKNMNQKSILDFFTPSRKRYRSDEPEKSTAVGESDSTTKKKKEETVELKSSTPNVLMAPTDAFFKLHEAELWLALQNMEIPKATSIANLLQQELRIFPITTERFSKFFQNEERSELVREETSTISLPYAVVVDTLVDISGTNSRLECVKLLTLLLLFVLDKYPHDLIPVMYLVINKQAPAHEGIELGIGDSILVKAVAECCGLAESRVKELYMKSGDLAEVAQENKCKQMTLVKPTPLTVQKVFKSFYSIAKMEGKDVVRRRLDAIKHLLNSAKGAEVNVIVRALQQKMRIGLAEPSALSALGYAFALQFLGAQRATEMPEEKLHAILHLGATSFSRAYAEVPSLEVITNAVLQHSFMLLVPGSTIEKSYASALYIRPGLPVRPQLASPTNGIQMILQRFQGKHFTSEFKYDGERAQIHYEKDSGFHIFSRNSETQTGKYPDLISLMPKTFNQEMVTSFIIDSEVVAIDPETEALKAFQVLQHRGRKNIKEEDVTVRVCIFVFDILYLNGEPVLHLSLEERRKLLYANFNPVKGGMAFAHHMNSDNVEDIQKYLEVAIATGCEGLMLKTLDEDATYTPSKRSHSWLKLKKDYMDGVTDTLDLVPIGAYYGKGKRTGVFGGFLMACYDADLEEYQSICKIGTGFKEEMLEEITKLLKPTVIEKKPAYYKAADTPDVWLQESFVWEIKAADLSISPVHCAARGLVDPEKGVALRFPRYLRRREDKSPSDATSATQVSQMYQAQSLAIQQEADPA